MKQFWQEVLPIDSYVVSSNGLLHDYDRKPITFLYQPLIGSTCLSLYITLWSQLEENRLSSQSFSHHSLMSIMNVNLKTIYEARLKLEGIGLLKTFLNEDDDERSFVYELQRPLSPEQFFLDGMLNVFLFSKIGKNQYIRLRNFFTDEKLAATNKNEEITKSFDDVFSSAGFEHNYTILEEEVPENNSQLISLKDQQSVQLANFKFDFDLLFATVKQSIVPQEAFTSKVQDAIIRLAFLYRIDALQMANIVISAVTENNSIDINELRKSARDWYQFENDQELPVLVDRIQPQINRTIKDEAQSKEDKLIQYLETTSPRQLLTDLASGARPSQADLKIVEDIMFKQNLPPGVVNVLLQYVMIKTDMKLSKAYIEKIASHWSRKKIVTVKEAMDLAISEHRQYTEWAENSKSKQKVQHRKGARTEKLPDWFKDHKSKSAKQAKKSDDDFDYEAERRRLEEKFKSKG